MRAYWHGDIDLDDRTHYYCQHHRTTHRVAGMNPAEWSDLHRAAKQADPDYREAAGGPRKDDHPNIFRSVALEYRRTHGRWRPYPEAPQSWSCDVAPAGAHKPLSVLLTTLERILGPFPGAYQAIAAHVHSLQPIPLPKPHEENRKRIYLHGDLNEILPRYYCEHHNAWHPTPAPSPLPGDVYRARRAKRYEHDGRREFRPKCAPCAWQIPKISGRPKRLPTTHELLWVCVANNTPIITE